MPPFCPLLSSRVCIIPANVFRDGKRITLDADQLVPGDVVSIKSGDRLPADMRLLQVSNLQVRLQTAAGRRGWGPTAVSACTW